MFHTVIFKMSYRKEKNIFLPPHKQKSSLILGAVLLSEFTFLSYFFLEQPYNRLPFQRISLAACFISYHSYHFN